MERYGGVTAEALVESAKREVQVIEELGYDNLVVSIKSSDVMMCVKAHELLARDCRYPLHVGITESGTLLSGNIKSSVGLGIILYEGIGDTIRVSLTGDPVEEIKSAKLILKALKLRTGGIEVVSCPTCGRTRIDLIGPGHPGGGNGGGYRPGCEGSRHGLCGQRTGRGQGGRYRNCRRHWRGTAH